jgi:hypothetical protein
MKKLLLSFAFLITFMSFGQISRDLEAVLGTPASGAVVAPGTISVEFSIKNNGPDPISAGDTIYFAYSIGQSIFSFDGTPNQVIGAIIPTGVTIPAGQSLPWAALSQVAGGGISINTATQTLPATICALVVGVGSASLTATGDPSDPDPQNNLDCFTVSANGASINENSVFSSVYPNPAQDILNIKVDGEISNITILTLDGKVVLSSSSSTINVSELTSGMYIYQVIVNDKISTGNFVKQ